MFFDIFALLCAQNKTTPYKACVDMGLNRSAVAKWKAGSTPNGTTLATMADYFGVSVDYLLGNEKEKAPTDDGERKMTEKDFKFALFGGNGDITDDMYDEVKRFAQYVRQQREREKDDKQ